MKSENEVRAQLDIGSYFQRLRLDFMLYLIEQEFFWRALSNPFGIFRLMLGGGPAPGQTQGGGG